MTESWKVAFITGVLGIIGMVFTGFGTRHVEQSKAREAVNLASVVSTAGIYEWQWAG